MSNNIQITPKVTYTLDGENIKIYDYIFDKNELFLEFKNYAAVFVSYIKLAQPKDNLYVLYRIKFISFISEVLNTYDKSIQIINDKIFNIEEYNESTIEDILNRLNLDNVKFNNIDYFKNMWGPRYWLFLHYTSFCVYKNKILTKSFSYLLLNLQLVLYCPECFNNFIIKNPFNLLTYRILKTNDPITSLFNFHNIVNTAIGKKNYTLDDLSKKYNTKYLEKGIISYKDYITI